MSEQKREERVIRAEIRTNAPPELAWQAWADPTRLAQWFVDGARGEAKEGGTLTWVWDEFNLEVPYRVLAAEAPSRLVLATPEQVAPPGLIEITIASKGGETIITVVNSGFQEGALQDDALVFPEGADWDDVFEGIRSGWAMTLALLKEYLEHYAGQPKRSFILMKPTELDARSVLLWFTNADRLQTWLLRSGAPGAVGETRPLELNDGTRLVGRTIARTERELALALPSERAVLELKVFPMGATTMVALRGTCWMPDEAGLARLRVFAAAAVERLAAELAKRAEPQPAG